MPSDRYVLARASGVCAAEFFHPHVINAGDLTKVTTYFPIDEDVRCFGVRPFTRARICQWCVFRDAIQEAARNEYGLLQFRDAHGDVWVFGSDGLMWTPETRPFTFDRVLRKFGPLRVVGHEGVRP